MSLRLLHLSDIHFGDENGPALAAATHFLREAPFDLLIVSGDLTQFGRPDEFAAAGAWFAALPGPKIATPGNHDTPWAGLAERLFAPFSGYARAIGPPANSAFETAALSAISLNTARGWQIRLNWSKGEISRRQTRTAVRALSASPPDAVRILVCHHPLVDIPSGPMTGRVRGGRAAAKRLEEAGVDLILTGHLHVPFVEALPWGDGRTFAVGAGTLSKRERGAPAGFNLIDIDGDRLTVTAMGWNGDALTDTQSWPVALRPRRGTSLSPTRFGVA